LMSVEFDADEDERLPPCNIVNTVQSREAK